MSAAGIGLTPQIFTTEYGAMASIPSSPDVERIEPDGAEATQCIALIKKLQLDSEYNSKNWNVAEIYKINKNKALRQSYEERKAQLGPGVREVFAFACAGKDKVVSIARDGVIIKPSRHAIGDTNHGINLCRWSDVQLKAAASCNYMRVNLLVFKIAYCKQKKVDAKEGNALLPDPNFDCHVSKNQPTIEEPIGDQLRKSQIYIYEYGENNRPIRRPRQVFPLVVIQFLRKCKPVTKAPTTIAPSTVVQSFIPVQAIGGNTIRIQPSTPVQVPAVMPLSTAIASGSQMNLNTGNVPILFHALQQPLGSGSQSPSSTDPRQLSPKFRTILPQGNPTSRTSSPGLVRITSHMSIGQIRGPSITSQSGMGCVRVSSSQTRPVATPIQVMNAATGQIFHVRMPVVGVPVSNAVYQRPVMYPPGDFTNPVAPAAAEALQLKTEERQRRARPVNDSIDLIEYEIDETNVIEIAPIEESEEEHQMDSTSDVGVPGAFVADPAAGTHFNGPMPENNDTLANAVNTEGLQGNDTDNNDAEVSQKDSETSISLLPSETSTVSVSTSTTQPRLASVEAEPAQESVEDRPAASVDNTVLNSVLVPTSTSSQPSLASVEAEPAQESVEHLPAASSISTVTSTSSERVKTVARSTNVAPSNTTSQSTATVAASAPDTSDHIDLTLDFDDVVDEFLDQGRRTSSDNPSTKDPSDETADQKPVVNGSKPETVAMKVEHSSGLLASDVILLDSDDDEDITPCADGDITQSADDNEDTTLRANDLDAVSNNELRLGLQTPATDSAIENSNRETGCDEDSPARSSDIQDDPTVSASSEKGSEEQIEDNSDESASHGKNESDDNNIEEVDGASAIEAASGNQTEVESAASVPALISVGRAPKSPIHDPEVSESEPSQESEQHADDYDQTKVFRVKANERRPHETIFEGTVFKIGDDGSVELVIERYFVRNRAKFVLSDDEDDDEEAPSGSAAETGVVQESVVEADPMELESEQNQNQEALSKNAATADNHEAEEPTTTSSLPGSTESASENATKLQERQRPESPYSTGSAGSQVHKKKKISKCPFVRGGVKRKKKQSKGVPSKMMAVEAPVEPMPEPEKKRVHGRRMPVDINKLREEALARAALDGEPSQPENENESGAVVDNENENTAVEENVSESADIMVSPSAAVVEEPSDDANAEDNEGLGLKVVDVRSEVEPPVKVEIDIAEEYTYCDTTEITYLCVPSPGTLPVVKIEQHDYNANYTSDLYQPQVVLRKLTFEQIRSHCGMDQSNYLAPEKSVSSSEDETGPEISQLLGNETDGVIPSRNGFFNNTPGNTERVRSDDVIRHFPAEENHQKSESEPLDETIKIQSADSASDKVGSASLARPSDENLPSNTEVKTEIVASESKNDSRTIKTEIFQEGKKKQKNCFISLLDNVSSEDEFLEETPKKERKTWKRKKSLVESSDDEDHDISKTSKLKTHKLKQKKISKPFIDSDDDSSNELNTSDLSRKSDSCKIVPEQRRNSLKEATQTTGSTRSVPAEMTQPKKVLSKQLFTAGDKVKSPRHVVASESSDSEVCKTYLKSKVNRLLSTDSEKTPESSPDNSKRKKLKKTKKDKRSEGSKLDKKSKSKHTDPKDKRPKSESQSSITPKKKLKLTPGAVLPKPGKNKNRRNIEHLSSPSAPDFSDSDLDFSDSDLEDFSSVPVKSNQKHGTSTVSSSPSERKPNPQPVKKEASNFPSVEMVPVKSIQKPDTSAVSSSPSERKLHPQPAGNEAGTSVQHMTEPIPHTLSKIAKTLKKLPKPISKLEQMRQKISTNQPEFTVFKPQKKQQPTDPDHIKNTAERYRRLSDSEQAEENKRKAIEIYKKNPKKQNLSETRSAGSKQSTPLIPSKRGFIHDSNKINSLLQDMKNEQTVLKREDTTRGSKEGTHKEDTRESEDNTIQTGDTGESEDDTVQTEEETRSKDGSGRKRENLHESNQERSKLGDLDKETLLNETEIPLVDGDMAGNIPPPEEETMQVDNDNGQNLDELYAEKDKLMIELAEDSGKTKLYTDSEEIQALIKKAKKKTKATPPETNELFNGYATGEECPYDQESQNKPDKWRAQMKKMSTSNLNVTDKDLALCKDALKILGQNKVSGVPGVQSTTKEEPKRNDAHTRRTSDAKSGNPRKKRKVLTASSEALALMKEQGSLPMYSSCNSASHSSNTSTPYYSGISEKCLPPWVSASVPCQRRKPKMFRPKRPPDLLVYLQKEIAEVENRIISVLSRINKLKGLLHDTEKSDSETIKTLMAVRRDYELDRSKLTIDREIIEKELAACTRDPMVFQFTRLPDDMLLPTEIADSVTERGTPLYTLHNIDESVYLEIQTFKLDIEMTRREIDGKPGMDRLTSLRNQLKWLYETRESRLKIICTCDAKSWDKSNKDLVANVEFYRGYMEMFMEDESENAERMSYIKERLAQCSEILKCQRQYQEKQKEKPKKAEVQTTKHKARTGCESGQHVTGSPRMPENNALNVTTVSSPVERPGGHPLQEVDPHVKGPAAPAGSGVQHPEALTLIPVEKTSPNYQEIKKVLMSLYPDGRLKFTRTLTLPERDPITYSVDCTDLRQDPRFDATRKTDGPTPVEKLKGGNGSPAAKAVSKTPVKPSVNMAENGMAENGKSSGSTPLALTSPPTAQSCMESPKTDIETKTAGEAPAATKTSASEQSNHPLASSKTPLKSDPGKVTAHLKPSTLAEKNLDICQQVAAHEAATSIKDHVNKMDQIKVASEKKSACPKESNNQSMRKWTSHSQSSAEVQNVKSTRIQTSPTKGKSLPSSAEELPSSETLKVIDKEDADKMKPDNGNSSTEKAASVYSSSASKVSSAQVQGGVKKGVTSAAGSAQSHDLKGTPKCLKSITCSSETLADDTVRNSGNSQSSATTPITSVQTTVQDKPGKGDATKPPPKEGGVKPKCGTRKPGSEEEKRSAGGEATKNTPKDCEQPTYSDAIAKSVSKDKTCAMKSDPRNATSKFDVETLTAKSVTGKSQELGKPPVKDDSGRKKSRFSPTHSTNNRSSRGASTSSETSSVSSRSRKPHSKRGSKERWTHTRYADTDSYYEGYNEHMGEYGVDWDFGQAEQMHNHAGETWGEIARFEEYHDYEHGNSAGYDRRHHAPPWKRDQTTRDQWNNDGYRSRDYPSERDYSNMDYQSERNPYGHSRMDYRSERDHNRLDYARDPDWSYDRQGQRARGRYLH